MALVMDRVLEVGVTLVAAGATMGAGFLALRLLVHGISVRLRA
ncbi:MAG TPA: hypothetical protein VN515_06960 [Terriglobales bacterium]|nr:hypothetical protein [Terriglobales bacterium]